MKTCFLDFKEYTRQKYGKEASTMNEDEYDNARAAYDEYLDRLADKGTYSLALHKIVKAD